MLSKENIEKIPKDYQGLNIKKIINYAKGWGKDYLCIEKIELYEAGSSFMGGKNILLLQLPHRLHIIFLTKIVNGDFRFSLKKLTLKEIRVLLKKNVKQLFLDTQN